MKILVVDDVALARGPIEARLKKEGHEVLTASDGVEALDLFLQHTLDLIITDIRMPVMDGIELLRRVKERNPDQEIIVVTGYAELETSVNALRLGASNYLMKPINLNELSMAVRAIESQQERERRLRAREERVARARKMADLGTVAAGVAHEINNPNTFIRGNVQTLIRVWPRLENFIGTAELFGTELPSSIQYILKEVPDILQAMLEGTTRITRIVEGLATFAKSEAGLPVERVDLNDCIREALELMKPEEGRRLVSWTPDPLLPPVAGAREPLLGIILNLIRNAVTAVEGIERGEIEVAATGHEAEKVRLVVRDNGKGIPEEDQKKVFVPFYTTHPKIGTPGLGLSTVYATAQRLGGDVSLSSRPGKGTTVTVELPAYPERNPS